MLLCYVQEKGPTTESSIHILYKDDGFIHIPYFNVTDIYLQTACPSLASTGYRSFSLNLFLPLALLISMWNLTAIAFDLVWVSNCTWQKGDRIFLSLGLRHWSVDEADVPKDFQSVNSIETGGFRICDAGKSNTDVYSCVLLQKLGVHQNWTEQ